MKLKSIFRLFIYVIVPLCAAAVISTPTQAQRSALKTVIIDAGHGWPDGGAHGAYSHEADIALAVAQKLVQKLQDSLPGIRVLMTRTDRNLPGGLSNPNEANRWRAKFANENHGDLFISIHCNDGGASHHTEITGHRTRVYYTGKGKHRKRHTKREPIYRSYTVSNTSPKGTETYVWAVNKNDDKQQFVQDNSNANELSGESDTSGMDYGSTEERIMATLRVKKYFSRSLLLANLIQDQYEKEGRAIHADKGNGVKQRDNKGIWVLQATAMPSILTEIGFITNPQEEDYLNSQSGQDQISSAILKAIVQYKMQLDAGKVTANF